MVSLVLKATFTEVILERLTVLDEPLLAHCRVATWICANSILFELPQAPALLINGKDPVETPCRPGEWVGEEPNTEFSDDFRVECVEHIAWCQKGIVPVTNGDGVEVEHIPALEVQDMRCFKLGLISG